MVVDITHTCPVMYEIFFHTHMYSTKDENAQQLLEHIFDYRYSGYAFMRRDEVRKDN